MHSLKKIRRVTRDEGYFNLGWGVFSTCLRVNVQPFSPLWRKMSTNFTIIVFKKLYILHRKVGFLRNSIKKKSSFSVFPIYLKNYLSYFKSETPTWKLAKFCTIWKKIDDLGQNDDHLKKRRIFIFKITVSQCNFWYRAIGLQNGFSVKRKNTCLIKFDVEYYL